MYSKHLLLSLTAVLMAAGCVIADDGTICDGLVLGTHPAVTPVAQDPNIVKWWPDRHEQTLEKVRQNRGNVDLLMIGDSITHRWEKEGKAVWDRYYGHRKALNLGFGGDQTQHVLWRLQNGEIEGLHPKAAVLLIGTNNSRFETTEPRHIAEGVQAIVCELQKRLPETKILVMGIFPKGSGEQRKDKKANAVLNQRWEKTDKANVIISRLADNEKVFYLNINEKLLTKDLVLTREIMPDLSHLSEKGFQIWAEAMEPVLSDLLNDPQSSK